MSEGLRQAGVNFSKLLSGKAAGALLSIVYLALAARELGPAGFGVMALMHGVVVFVGALIAFSGWQTLVRFGQDPLRHRDAEGLASIVRFSATIELALAGLAILVSALVLPMAARAGDWGAEAEAVGPLYAFAILATARQTPFGILQLFKRYDWLAFHAAVMPIMRLVGTLVVIALGLGLTGFLIAWMLAAVIEGFTLWALGLILLRREGQRWPGLGRLRDTLHRFPGIGRFAFVSNADYTLVNMGPLAIPLLVGAVLGPAAAGLFSLAVRATNALTQPAQLAAQGSFAIVSDLAARREWSRLRTMLARGATIAMGAGAIVAFIFTVSGDTVMALFGGAEFAAAGGVLALVAIARALGMAGPALASTLAALHRPGTSLAINASTGLALVPLMVWAMHRWHLDGAGYSLIVQALVATVLAGIATFAAIRTEVTRDAAR